MFLHRQNALIFCTGLLLLCFLLITFTHSDALTNRIPVGNTSLSVAEPTMEMYGAAQKQGMNITEWTVYWRGTVSAEEQEKWRYTLAEQDFKRISASEAEMSGPGQGMDLTEQERWEKKGADGVHLLQLFHHPRKSNQSTTYIYAWSGQEVDDGWKHEYEHIHSALFAELRQDPQTFSCLEGYADATLNDSLWTEKNVLDHTPLASWIRHDLSGEVTHHISEPQFVSMNGYIPAWSGHTLSAGDNEMNLQISARYNKQVEQTRLTIGYPLILTEH